MIKSKIRVLYFVDRFLQGGIQTLLWNIATSIDRDSFEIEFLCLDDGKTYPMEQDLAGMGFKVTKLDGIWLDSPVSFLRYRKALDAFLGILILFTFIQRAKIIRFLRPQKPLAALCGFFIHTTPDI